MSASAQNMEAIVKAKAAHNASCAFPPHTVVLHPHDIERLGWEVGDDIAGLKLDADPAQQPHVFGLICDGSSPSEIDDDAIEAVSRDTERDVIKVGG